MKFMESFLANRPKIDSGAGGAPDAVGSESISPYGMAGGLEAEGAFGMGFASPGGGFRSLRDALLENGSVVEPGKTGSLPLASKGDPREAPGTTIHEGSEPTVELVMDGDRIAKVVVTCACCRKIELDCTY